MIKELQKKFITIAMCSMLIVVTALIGTINAVNIIQADMRAGSILQMLSKNNGIFPEFKPEPAGRELPSLPNKNYGFEMTPESQFETRYFAVYYNADGAVERTDITHIASLTEQQAREYAQKALDSGRETGYDGYYKFLVTGTQNGTSVVFLNRRQQLQSILSFLAVSCSVAVVSLLVVFLLVTLLSRKAIRPVIENYEKQKRFITDAGHEIKTPLSVISANTDVLEMKNGENEWTHSIRCQTERLDILVKNLIMLAKTDEESFELVYSDFSLSDAVWEIAEAFETVAQASGKSLEMNIQPHIMFRGDEAGIKELISILADNAMKYSEKTGSIEISLKKHGKNAVLEVSNSCLTVDSEQLDRIFDRFYRADPSRSRETGGYGLGLSIAKAIVTSHKGSIAAKKTDDGKIVFTVILSV